MGEKWLETEVGVMIDGVYLQGEKKGTKRDRSTVERARRRSSFILR